MNSHSHLMIQNARRNIGAPEMRHASFSYFWLSASCFAFLGILNISAHAQTPATRNDVTITIDHASLDGKNLIVQFTADNKSKGTMYIMDSDDRSQWIMTNKGQELHNMTVDRIKHCGVDLKSCLHTTNITGNADRYTPIEPGEKFTFSFRYNTTGVPVSDNDKISFTVAIVARAAAAIDPTQLSKPVPLQYNFSGIPLE